MQSSSPVKESSYLNRETSADMLEKQEGKGKKGEDEELKKLGSISPPPHNEGIPIRR